MMTKTDMSDKIGTIDKKSQDKECESSHRFDIFFANKQILKSVEDSCACGGLNIDGTVVSFKKCEQQHSIDSEACTYVAQATLLAQHFVDAVQTKERTLIRVSDCIVSKQRTTCPIKLWLLIGMSKVLRGNHCEEPMVKPEGA